MNCIGGLASKGYELFDYTKNVVSQIIPDENSVIGRVVGKTVEVGKGVFQGVAPHLVCMSPMYLSRMTNIRLLSLIGFVYGLSYHDQPHESWLGTATEGVLMATNVIGAADLLGFTPLETEYRVAVDSLLLLATAIGSSRAIYKGTNRMVSSWSAEGRSTTSKVSDFVSGAILTTLGAIGLGNSLQASARLVSGIKTLQTLDSVQKKGVLKHRAIQGLGEAKSCRAVIISGDTVIPFLKREVPFPFSDFLYEKCETRSYSVENPSQFCEALSNAKNYFGRTIDVLVTEGHANNELQVLGDGYYFKAGQQEITCMKKVLSSEAQVFALGCNTATPLPYEGPTLIKKLSEDLPGRDVVGFSAYYNPLLTTSSFSNGRFHHDNHIPYSLNGLTLPSSVVIEKKP